MAALSALWADVGSKLWRGARPVVTFSTHVALRCNAHRVSILRDAEARGRALRARLLGGGRSSGGSGGSSAECDEGDEVLATPQPTVGGCGGGGDDGERDGEQEEEYVLSRVASPPLACGADGGARLKAE
jgi:hypothetical protein